MNDISAREPRRLLSALSLRHIHYFVTLSQVLNFRMAAETLALTTSALSASIKETERLVGSELFVRNGHQVMLSEVGQAVLPIAEHLLNTAANAVADMTRVGSELQQTVRIGLVPSVARRVLARLAVLQEANPQLRFEFFDSPTRTLISDVEKGKVDFGIGAGAAIASAGLTTIKLITDEVVAVMRKDDPLGKERSVTWSQLSERQVAHFVRGGVADLALGSSKANKIVVNAAYQVTFTETLYSLVSAGFCVGLVPRLTAESLVDAALAWKAIVKPRIVRDIVIVHTSRPARTSAVSMCIAFLKAGC